MVDCIECFPWQKWSQHLFKCSGESWGSQQSCGGALVHPQPGRAIPSHGSGARCSGAAEAERWSLELLLLVQLVNTSGSRDGR